MVAPAGDLGDFEKTIITLDKIIEIQPDTIQHYASLAIVYKKSGNLKKAKETALKILKINPEAQREVDEFIQKLENNETETEP